VQYLFEAFTIVDFYVVISCLLLIYGSWIYSYLCVTGVCLDMSRLVVAKQKARAQTDKVIELVDDGYLLT
jgi:actin-related protein